MKKLIYYFPYLAWVIALSSIFGSLLFSEVLKYPPCVLCWYQRSLMYPLSLIIPIGILRKDKGLPIYVLPLTVLGLLIAFYHNLIYFNIIPEAAAPCTVGVPCNSRQLDLLGFITIPMLSMTSFLMITVLMYIIFRYNSSGNK